MTGAEAVDPLARGLAPADLSPLPPVDLATLRIGVSEDLGFFPVDPLIGAAFAGRVAALRGLARSVEAVVPPLGDPHATFEALRGAAFLASHRERLERTPDAVGPRIRENMATASRLTAVEVIEAEKAQARIFRAFRAMFRGIDLFVCPTVAVPPFDRTRPYVDAIGGRTMRTYIEWVGLTWGITLTASPVVALPTGLDGTGMPFGVQIVGPSGHDRFVMAAAAAIEAAFAGDPALARPIPPR
jgi:Asp-tRNA(Asn)/Glu-tRNA(Gln) amidotransferase A subunit family amidase